MSTQFSTPLDTTTDELQQAYNAVLLQISHDLEKDQQGELRFYCNRLIPKGTSGTLDMLRSLEYAGKMSWKDVCFLKEGLHQVRRLDLVKSLTTFEIKRDLTLLLDQYARTRQGSQTSCRQFSSIEMVCLYLVKLTTETAQDRYHFSNIGSLVESRKGFEKVLLEFEDEIERELSHPWSKLTMLVVIAGEIISEALTNNEHRRKLDVMKLCSIAADELYFRMIKLGSWEDFCDHVEERYNSVYQHNSVSDDCNLFVKKNIADVVQQFKKTTFFL